MVSILSGVVLSNLYKITIAEKLVALRFNYHLITYASELIQSYSTFQTTLHLIALGNEKVDPCPPAAPLFVLNHTNLL